MFWFSRPISALEARFPREVYECCARGINIDENTTLTPIVTNHIKTEMPDRTEEEYYKVKIESLRISLLLSATVNLSNYRSEETFERRT